MSNSSSIGQGTVTAGGLQDLRIHNWQAFRYVRLRVHDAFEPLVLDDFRAEVVEYPFEERGAFPQVGGRPQMTSSEGI